MKQKKIAFILSSLNGGGAEKMILNICEELANKKYDIDLILANKSGEYILKIPPNIRVIDLDTSREIASLHPLITYLRKNKPETVVSTGTGMNTITCLAKIFSQVDFRLVIRIQNTMSKSVYAGSRVEHRILPYLVKKTFPIADNIIAISNGVAVDLASITKLSIDDIKVIYNPVVSEDIFDLAKKKPDHRWFENEESTIILGVGRLVEQKNFETLIHAFALFRQKTDSKLIILGEGQKEDHLKKITKRLGVSDYVSLPGFVDNPYSYMQSADMFVQSSAWEGFGNVLVEAMACETPVVSTNCPHGPAEILEGGKYGSIVPVGDYNALCNAMNSTLRDPPETTILLERALDFTVERITDEYAKNL